MEECGTGLLSAQLNPAKRSSTPVKRYSTKPTVVCRFAAL